MRTPRHHSSTGSTKPAGRISCPTSPTSHALPRNLGFAGLAFDEEDYPSGSGGRPTWDWHYPGNTHSEADVRAKVRQRGVQIMTSIVAGFPNAEIVDYFTFFPEGWEPYVQEQINGSSQTSRDSVQINLWDGLTSVNGYGPIRFINSIFYKTNHIAGASWDTALSFDVNRTYAYLSRNLSNWSYASSRINWSAFAWISAGPSAFEAARDPGYVAGQLAAFRRWGTGGAFANYVHSGLEGFDYGPYVAGLKAAAAPGMVDTQPPGASVSQIQRSGGNVSISGSATDNMGIRSVRWRTASGAEGAAKMTWVITGGDVRAGYQWRTDWSTTVPSTSGEVITITVEDIKGPAVSMTVRA